VLLLDFVEIQSMTIASLFEGFIDIYVPNESLSDDR